MGGMSEPIAYRFPFGQTVKEVCQTDRTPKEVFILGVYASAVHARWVRPNGEKGIAAVAVASELCIFWRADNDMGKEERQIIEQVNATISQPESVGKLVPPAKGMNGPSGRALDEKILKPLGFIRDEAWLCDLVPRSCRNPRQDEALHRPGGYCSIMAKYGLPEPNWPPVPPVLADDQRRQEILAELDESQSRLLVLLGDQPIRWFLSAFEPRFERLDDFKPYGERQSVSIDHRCMEVVALVHPRQAAQLGRYSKEWFNRHQDWVSQWRDDPIYSSHPTDHRSC